MSRTFAVANQKGGVGKTTTAINLAASLAAAEKRTLLVDFDPQGNATSGMGFAKNGLHPTIYQVLVGECSGADAVKPTTLQFLRLLPADVHLIGAEIELVNSPQREDRLKEALADLHSGYDYIIIDCPPSLGLLTVNALSAADGVIIPLQCEYYALEGLTQLMNTIRLIRDNFNHHLTVRGILLTMFDTRTNISQQVVDEVRRHFSSLVFQTTIPRNVKLSEAPSFGKPILLYDIRSRGAEAYLGLAKEIIASEQKSSR